MTPDLANSNTALEELWDSKLQLMVQPLRCQDTKSSYGSIYIGHLTPQLL